MPNNSENKTSTENLHSLSRRKFIGTGLMTGMAIVSMSTINRAFAQASPSLNSVGQQDIHSERRLPRRKLGSLEVSSIGMGCLPMVGYYGGDRETAKPWCH